MSNLEGIIPWISPFVEKFPLKKFYLRFFKGVYKDGFSFGYFIQLKSNEETITKNHFSYLKLVGFFDQSPE
jgi:hypothetical protein